MRAREHRIISKAFILTIDLVYLHQMPNSDAHRISSPTHRMRNRNAFRAAGITLFLLSPRLVRIHTSSGLASFGVSNGRDS